MVLNFLLCSSCDSIVHPQRENFEVYLQTLVSQVLDPEFIPEIIKENGKLVVYNWFQSKETRCLN